MDNYVVEFTVRANASCNVNAESAEDAEEKVREGEGVELVNINEIVSWEVESAEFFQKGEI